MIRTVALLGLVASASALFGLFDNNLWKAGLSYKFDTNPLTWGSSAFMDLPRNSKAAAKKGWTAVPRPTRSYSSGYDALVLWINPKDVTVGILVDENGQTSGLQIAIPSDGLTSYYDMKKQGFSLWNFNKDYGVIEKYWTICKYYVSEDEVARKASYNEDLLLRDDHITVEGINGELFKVATNLSNVDSIWTKQACVPLMGLHYYYDMTESLSCDEPLFPWFPMYDASTKQLIATGLMFLGSYKTSTTLETPSKAAVKFIVPTGPKCLYDLTEQVGVLSLHTYYVNNPKLILC